MYKYKFSSTYRYFYTSISSVTPTKDLNKYKYKFCSTYGYFRISISWVTPKGDLYKYKSAISLLYEFMINPDICYCIFVIVICLLYKSISACVHI